MTFKEFYQKATDTIYVHFIWLLVSVLGLLITFGAATAALNRVMFQIYKKDEPTSVFSLFFSSFKENFKYGTYIWLITIFIGVPLYFMIDYAIRNVNLVLMVLGIVIAYYLLFFLIYGLSVIAIFKSKNFIILTKNILLIQTRFLFSNILILGNFAIIILLAVFVRIEFVLLFAATFGFITTIHLRKPFGLLKQDKYYKKG